MSEPLVSIVCIVFNHEPFLRQCLDGFVMQKTDFPVEILIHDDASTDGSADIIREYEAKYPDLFRPIYQVENQYSQGNDIWYGILFPRAKGKYIAICEGDDFWTDPLKLQKQIDFLENHPDFSMCFHSASILRQGVGDLKTGAKFESIEEREYESTEIFTTWLVPTASIVFRKDTVLSHRTKHPEWLNRGDINLVLKCLATGRVWGMSGVMSVYRMQPGSVLHNEQFRSKAVFDLPRHFKCLYINYPKVDSASIKGCIAQAYYTRMKRQKHLLRRISDLLCVVYWSPKYAVTKVCGRHRTPLSPDN